VISLPLNVFYGVGDTEIDPKSDILGQAGIAMRTDRCLDFPA
jgi:hypothetical protein